MAKHALFHIWHNEETIEANLLVFFFFFLSSFFFSFSLVRVVNSTLLINTACCDFYVTLLAYFLRGINKTLRLKIMKLGLVFLWIELESLMETKWITRDPTKKIVIDLPKFMPISCLLTSSWPGIVGIRWWYLRCHSLLHWTPSRPYPLQCTDGGTPVIGLI